MTHSDYNILTSKIISLFHRECSGTYYVPAISKSNIETNSCKRKNNTDKIQYCDELNNIYTKYEKNLITRR